MYKTARQRLWGHSNSKKQTFGIQASIFWTEETNSPATGPQRNHPQWQNLEMDQTMDNVHCHVQNRHKDSEYARTTIFWLKELGGL